MEQKGYFRSGSRKMGAELSGRCVGRVGVERPVRGGSIGSMGLEEGSEATGRARMDQGPL